MTHHALVIGLDQTQDRHIQALRFACADAQAIHATLQQALGYGDQAHLLLHPDMKAVRAALVRIQPAVRAGDTFVFYFAGHGAQEAGEQYLLLHEASLVELERGDVAGNDLLPLGWLMRKVAEDWPAVQAAYILDACRSPLRRGARSGAYSAQVQDVLAGVQARDLALRRRGAVSDVAQPGSPGASLVINACGDGEQAFELEALGRGQFSHGLECWLKAGRANEQPRVLSPQAAQEIAVLVDDAARQHQGRRGQRPWLPPQAAQVVLWRPFGSRLASVAPAAAGGASPPALEVSTLLERFERQLAAGRLRTPAWDCCMGTIALLHQAALSEVVLAAYQARVERAEAGVSPLAPSEAGTTAAPPMAPATDVIPVMAVPVAMTASKPMELPLAQRPAGFRFRDADWAPEMVVIPAGEFVMGSPDYKPERIIREGPQHRVVIDQAFAMGRCVVTFEDYDRFVQLTGATKPNDLGWGRGRRPVIQVSWDDAQAYIAWLNQQLGLAPERGYRLPSDAEWEYAARAGSATAFWWGNSLSTQQANYNGNSTYNGGERGEFRQRTVEADAFEANPWGLLNVHGNVWEWVQDIWHDDYQGAPGSQLAWHSGGDPSRRVVRGGSWDSYPRNLRSAGRGRSAPDYRDYGIGFRLARTL